MPSGAVRLKLMGVPAVFTADGSEIPLGSHDAVLLSRLALDGPQVREEMAAWLWHESTPDARSNNLRQRLYRINRIVDCPIVATGRQLELTPQVDTDLVRADWKEAALLACQPLLHGTEHKLPELPTEWLLAARGAFAARIVDALLAWVASYEQQSNWVGALRCSIKARELQPLEEAHFRRVIRFHYLLGERAAAKEVYSSCVDMLANEFRAKPAKETRALISLLDAPHAGIGALSVLISEQI